MAIQPIVNVCLATTYPHHFLCLSTRDVLFTLDINWSPDLMYHMCCHVNVEKKAFPWHFCDIPLSISKTKISTLWKHQSPYAMLGCFFFFMETQLMMIWQERSDTVWICIQKKGLFVQKMQSIQLLILEYLITMEQIWEFRNEHKLS